MKLQSTLERVRAFGGMIPFDPSIDDEDYHRYAGTTWEPDDDQLDDDRFDDDDAADDTDTDADPTAAAGPGWRAWWRRDRNDAGPAAVEPVVEPKIDPRIAARRRDIVLERDVRRQRRWLAFAVATTVVALLFGITRSSLLDLDTIIASDGTRVTADEIRAASRLKAGEPLLGLDLDGAAARVRALPWVATAQAERDWDGTVRLRVTERTPAVAVVLDDGSALLVDVERRVLARVPGAPADLIPITGVPATDPGATLDPAVQPAVDVARGLTPGVGTRVAAVHVLPGGQLELALRPGGRVVLGSGSDLERKLLATRTMLGQVDLHQLCVLDVRVPDAPVLTRAVPCA